MIPTKQMPKAKLKFNDREITIGESLVTIGRSSDNMVSFSGDSNISRYHAEIEARGEDYYLIELGSSNGTTLNGESITGEKLLKEGDLIVLGGTSQVEFLGDKEETEKKEDTLGGNPSAAAASTAASDTADSQERAEISQDAQAPSKFPVMLGVAAITCGLAVVCVVGAVLYSYSKTGQCEAKAIITKPESNETLSEQTEVETEIEGDADCVSRAIFLIDGEGFADTSEQPFTVTLDPKRFPTLADGLDHKLQVVLEDAEGNRIIQPGEIALVFETKNLATPTPAPEETPEETPTPTPKSKGKVTVIEVQAMSNNLIKSLGNFGYKLDKKLLEEIQVKTADYASAEGYSARALQHQDKIKNAYLTETDVGSPIGFILAMSRSKFDLQKQGAEEGLWRMTNDFAAANAYNQGCEIPSLSDPAQACAARASSLYLKTLLRTIFDGEAIYAIAAFGMPPDKAYEWKQSLPPDHSDLSKVLKSPQREELVKFFAAGIVAENPQKFGLKKNQPISKFY